jgi:murein DD-endopeptidase MepM/ murein hydrolase activator NlpD
MSKNSPNFSIEKYKPIVELSNDYEVFDFTKGYDPFRPLKSLFGIGRYNEKRVGMYEQPLFENARNIHMGIDIGAPVNTKVYGFFKGEVFLSADNDQAGDYGPTIITKHLIDNVEVYALYGHLSRESLDLSPIGKKLETGDLVGWVGDKSVNGGWNPHVHFQLCLYRPEKADLPGVVSERDRENALANFPDPRLVLGPIY